MDDAQIQRRLGIPAAFRATTVKLFDAVFGQKIALAIADKEKRRNTAHPQRAVLSATATL